jgi:hypothetical protein
LGIFAVALIYLLPKEVARIDQDKSGLDSSRSSAALPPPQEIIPEGEGFAALLETQTVEAALDSKAAMWYYFDKERLQCGPVGFQALRQDWLDQKIGVATYVWCEGMKVWEKIDDLPSLKNSLV